VLPDANGGGPVTCEIAAPDGDARCPDMTIRRTATVLLTAAALGGTAAACSRSAGSSSPTNAPATGGGATASATPASAGKGDFGDLKGICGPGDAKGATAKGVTDTEIRLGTSADPGAAAAPGLEQEFFDGADAFVKWCNDAGGILGRKLVVDKWDAKLFNVGQAFTNACQKDFMLVGNGNSFDSAGVKPREDCKQGDIYGYTVSPEAARSKYQVSVVPSNPEQYPYGPLRLLTEAYPDTKAGVGIGSSNLASLTAQGKRVQQALKANGIKVTSLQEQPPLVPNYRPYIEEFKNTGTKGLFSINGQDISPIYQAMKNVGWTPQFVLFSVQYYIPQQVQAAKSLGNFPPTYVGLANLPFELAGPDHPVLTQVKSMLDATIKNPRYTFYTSASFSAWALFAKEAKACGSQLTSDCVLSKAAAEKGWTGGGLFAPTDLDPIHPQLSQCWLDIRLTPTGWVYDKKVTNPNQGLYNCDPKNVAAVDSFQ
jgi:ABC-type branched-subunit amino acid transport system substrate-binding protein